MRRRDAAAVLQTDEQSGDNYHRRNLAASVVVGVLETEKLPTFCAEHDILLECEMIRMKDIKDAPRRRTKQGVVRYRLVINIAGTMLRDV